MPETASATTPDAPLRNREWTRHKRSVRRYVLLFVLLSAVYHSNLRPVASGDSLPAALLPFSILLDGSIALDRFGPYISEHIWYGPFVLHQSGGHWYSRYCPIAGPALATPLYLPLLLAPSIGRQPPATLLAIARVAEKVVAVALAAGTALALLLLLGRLTSQRAAWMLTLVFALGTGNWSASSQALWQHTFGQLAIAGCLYAVERWSSSGSHSRWYWIAGAFAGVALAIRLTNLALVPALAVALWFEPARRADYARVFAPLAAAAAALAAYNFAVFHSFTGGYATDLGHPLAGLAGILLSPGRGLLIYTPIAMFALAAVARGARESLERHRLVAITAAVFSVVDIAWVAAWPVWWGGYCWGPRLLTEILVPAMVLIAVGLPAIRGGGWRWAFAVTAVYCCLIQALGVYCYPKGHWDHLPVSVNNAPARLWSWTDNPVIRTVRGGVVWEPYSIVGAAVTGGLPAAAEKLRELGINSY